MALLFKKDSRLGLRTIFLLFVALILVALDSHSRSLEKMRTTFSLISSPIAYVASAPIDLINDVVNVFSRQKNLLSENAELKTENALLKTELQKQIAIQSENKMLKALLQSSTKAGGHISEAQILSVSLNPNIPEIIINQGSKDGVFEGQAVLDANGVMGQVVHLEPHSSHVMLVTHSKSAIPVESTRNHIRSLLVGDGANHPLKLEYITASMDLKPGDTLMTSGLGGIFPYGYAVGTITAVKTTPNDRFISVTVEPSAGLNQSRLVMLVWPKNHW